MFETTAGLTTWRNLERALGVAVLLSAILILIVLAYAYLPDGIDWRDTYRPAALKLLAGQSPYDVLIFFAAPWGLIPLAPFALLPVRFGRVALFVVGMATFAFTAYRLGGRKITLIAFFLSPPVLHGLLNGNIEWLPLLGFILPPRVGLLFVSVKPQIGIGVAAFWLFQSWRAGGAKESLRVFAPLIVSLAVSFVLFGLWPLRFQETLALTRGYNASLWPMSLPIGAVLLVKSLRRNDIKPAMAASPFLSPYVLLHAWAGALASLAESPLEMVVAVAGLWGLVLLRLWQS